MYFPTVGKANSANYYSVMWEGCDQCVHTFSIDRVCRQKARSAEWLLYRTCK